MSDDADRLKYLNNGQLREEIAYAVGADPSRYGPDSSRGITIAHARAIGVSIQPPNTDVDLDAMDLGEVYKHVCRWAGGEYQPNAGKPWGINRENLKEIHRAVGGRKPREVVSV